MNQQCEKKKQKQKQKTKQKTKKQNKTKQKKKTKNKKQNKKKKHLFCLFYKSLYLKLILVYFFKDFMQLFFACFLLVPYY